MMSRESRASSHQIDHQVLIETNVFVTDIDIKLRKDGELGYKLL